MLSFLSLIYMLSHSYIAQKVRKCTIQWKCSLGGCSWCILASNLDMNDIDMFDMFDMFGREALIKEMNP